MKIDFENDAKYLTAYGNDGSVVIRCNTEYTDLRDDECIDDFIIREGVPKRVQRTSRIATAKPRASNYSAPRTVGA